MSASLLSLCQWIQDTPSSTALRESTWGFPIIGALHVLGIAWFGGALLVRDPQFRTLTRAGFAAMLLTGALLFWVEPLKCYNSPAFRVKMPLFALACLIPVRSRLSISLTLALWTGVILAGRAIAFF